jgi:mRNA interferase RelE/StbE
MYQITFRSSAVKELRKLPADHRKGVSSAIDSLAHEPRPKGVKKMAGVHAWRLRVGVYRVVYSIEDKRLIIEVIRIGHRREVYR